MPFTNSGGLYWLGFGILLIILKMIEDFNKFNKEIIKIYLKRHNRIICLQKVIIITKNYKKRRNIIKRL
jgi:hypothetical protein